MDNLEKLNKEVNMARETLEEHVLLEVLGAQNTSEHRVLLRKHVMSVAGYIRAVASRKDVSNTELHRLLDLLNRLQERLTYLPDE